MPVMNLLVAFNGSDASVAALRYAASLAKQRGAHVTAILAHTAHEVIDRRSRWIPEEARALLEAANSEILAEVIRRFEELRPALGLGDALDFREETGRVDTLLSEGARYYDMLIVGARTESDDAHVTHHPDLDSDRVGENTKNKIPIKNKPGRSVAGSRASPKYLVRDS